MALLAAGVGCRPAADYLPQCVVERTDKLGGLRVTACQELFRLFVMADLAVLGRYQHDDFVAIVVFGIRPVFAGSSVTSVTIDTFIVMLAVTPVLHDSRRNGLMASQA